MMRLLALLGVLMMASPVLGQADPGRVRSLVPLLGDADFRKREQAGAELLSMGDSAISELKDAAKELDQVEASERLRVIIQKLEMKRISEPSRITYKCVRKSHAEVFADLSRLSGCTIELSTDIPATHVTFDWRNVPILQAIDELCDTLIVHPTIVGNPARMVITNQDHYCSHRYYHGPLRISVAQVSTSSNRQLNNISRKSPHHSFNRNTSIQFIIDAEPKIRIAGAASVILTELIDDTGKDWLRAMGHRPDDPEEEPVLDQRVEYPSSSTGTFVYFDGANRRAEQIKSLKGKSAVRVITSSKTRVEVAQVMKNLGKGQDGTDLAMTVQKLHVGSGIVSIEIAFRRKRGQPEDSSWIEGLVQNLQIITTQGARLELRDLDSQEITPNGYVATINYSFTGKEPTIDTVRLVQHVWQSLPFQVEMKDIPLP
jgi:hypothetical protein